MDFRVPRPKLLFTSRPQFSCRDSIHVATSISCRDINLCPCWFQLIACDVVTSWSCRDIHSSTLQSSIVVPDVTTSGCCRDMGSNLLHPFTGGYGVATSVFLSRHQLLVLYLERVSPDVVTSTSWIRSFR